MPKIETIRIPEASLKAIDDALMQSFRWSRDHKGEKYKHAAPCEWCLQQGLLHALVAITDGTVGERRREYVEKVNAEKKSRKKTKKTAAKKRVVVRKKR